MNGEIDKANKFVLLKSFDHLNSGKATKNAARQRWIKRVQRVLSTSQPVRKCEELKYCYSIQPSIKCDIIVTVANRDGVFEIDNSFKSKMIIQSDYSNDRYYYSHVVSQRHIIGGHPEGKVNVFDNETKQVVYLSTKYIIDIEMPNTRE